ncbi:MAG: DUF456 domain-containing protein [Patescibacteria group bacterium]|jgi:hypothetical protein
MSDITLIIVAGVLMLPGLLGVFLPILPGIPFMFVIALICAIITKFTVLSGIEIGYLAGLMILSLLVDFLSGMLGAKMGGASGKSLLIGMVGLLLGTLLLPPFGGILGMFIGVVAGEIYFFGKTKAAIKAATGSVLGALTGAVINLIVGLVFVGLFFVFAI